MQNTNVGHIILPMVRTYVHTYVQQCTRELIMHEEEDSQQKVEDDEEVEEDERREGGVTKELSAVVVRCTGVE